MISRAQRLILVCCLWVAAVVVGSGGQTVFASTVSGEVDVTDEFALIVSPEGAKADYGFDLAVSRVTRGPVFTTMLFTERVQGADLGGIATVEELVGAGVMVEGEGTASLYVAGRPVGLAMYAHDRLVAVTNRADAGAALGRVDSRSRLILVPQSGDELYSVSPGGSDVSPVVSASTASPVTLQALAKAVSARQAELTVAEQSGLSSAGGPLVFDQSVENGRETGWSSSALVLIVVAVAAAVGAMGFGRLRARSLSGIDE